VPAPAFSGSDADLLWLAQQFLFSVKQQCAEKRNMGPYRGVRSVLQDFAALTDAERLDTARVMNTRRRINEHLCADSLPVGTWRREYDHMEQQLGLILGGRGRTGQQAFDVLNGQYNNTANNTSLSNVMSSTATGPEMNHANVLEVNRAVTSQGFY
jgi:hypothetical protein